MIADRIDIEKYRAGNVARTILCVPVTLLCRQKQRAVDDGDIAVAQMLGQPVG